MPLTAEWMFLWFLCYSFAGWVYESALVSAQERRWVNRGFLNGPLCPIYGVGAVLASVLLTPLKAHPLLIFAISALGASALEYATSWAMERLFHARWWDYSNFRFNLNGRICLLGAVVFGIAGVLIVEIVHPWVAMLTHALPLPALHWLCFITFVLIACDCAVTVAGMLNFEQVMDTVKQTVQEYVAKVEESRQRLSMVVDAAKAKGEDVFGEKSPIPKDLLERVRSVASEVMNAQQHRMISSFPKLSMRGHDEVLAAIRELIRRHHR